MFSERIFMEELMNKYLNEAPDAKKLKKEYLDWVKKKGHLVSTASSVFGDFVQEKKLSKQEFEALVKEFWTVTGDRERILPMYDKYIKNGG